MMYVSHELFELRTMYESQTIRVARYMSHELAIQRSHVDHELSESRTTYESQTIRVARYMSHELTIYRSYVNHELSESRTIYESQNHSSCTTHCDTLPRAA